MLKELRFTDLLITIMLGVVFGVIMKFWDDMYSVIKPILPVARQLLYGMWFMVAPFAFLLIRKLCTALLASIASAGLSAFKIVRASSRDHVVNSPCLVV